MDIKVKVRQKTGALTTFAYTSGQRAVEQLFFCQKTGSAAWLYIDGELLAATDYGLLETMGEPVEWKYN